MDSLYELGASARRKAEQCFPADAIRAHLWASVGRKKLQRRLLAGSAVDDLSIFLGDLHLGPVVHVFRGLGFRELRDLLGLSAADCRENFPFLQPGDQLRLGRSVELLNEEVIAVCRRRADAGLTKVPLPPPISAPQM